MEVAISPEMEAFVKRKVKSGSYRTPEEVVYAGLRLLDECTEAELIAMRDKTEDAHKPPSQNETNSPNVEDS